MRAIMLKGIFLKFLLIVFLGSIFGVSYADYSISFGVNSREYKTCRNCNYSSNDIHSSYCSNCGETFQKPAPPLYRCSNCYFPFVLAEDNSYTRCENCNDLNMINNRFCNSCGVKIFVKRVFVKCPQCFAQVENACPYTENRKKYCRKCDNSYYANYRRCPHCQYYRSKKRKKRYHKTDDKRSSSYKRYPEENSRPPANDKKYHTKKQTYHSKSTLISSFTKNDYAKSVKKISIAAVCSQRSFSKVVVNVKKSGKYAPIVNMIKIKHNNRYLEYPQGIRLNAGRNQFNVNVPENSSQLVLSYDHGKGSVVNIYLE